MKAPAAPNARLRRRQEDQRTQAPYPVDTDGRLLMVNLTRTDISAGAQVFLDAIRKRWFWIKHLFADGAYDRRKLMDKAAFKNFVIEIVRRIDSDSVFKALPRRWVVERTFSWMTCWRRLVRDYEQRENRSDNTPLIVGKFVPHD